MIPVPAEAEKNTKSAVLNKQHPVDCNHPAENYYTKGKNIEQRKLSKGNL